MSGGLRARMSRRSRRVAATGAALGTALTLAACGGVGPEAPSTACEPSEGAVTLSFWSWVPGMDEAVAIWNKENPDIQVRLNAVAGGNQGTYQNLFNALKAETEPDLAQVEFGRRPATDVVP